MQATFNIPSLANSARTVRNSDERFVASASALSAALNGIGPVVLALKQMALDFADGSLLQSVQVQAKRNGQSVANSARTVRGSVTGFVASASALRAASNGTGPVVLARKVTALYFADGPLLQSVAWT